MADKTIGQLPSASQVTDGTLIPIEQSNVAQKMTGAQFKAWAVAGAQPYSESAAAAAQNAADSAAAAGSSATAAGNSAAAAAGSAAAASASQQAIENMGVAAQTLDPGSQATVAKSSSGGVVTLTFGLPRGATGAQGATGPAGQQGVQGPRGDTGTAVAVETSGMFYLHVDNNSASSTYGHLFLTYSGTDAPDIYIDPDDGHLKWNIS